MKILASGLAAAVLLLSAAPVSAAEPPPAIAAQSRADDEALGAAMQEWMAAVVNWTDGYNALIDRQIETMTWLDESANTLEAKLEAGGPRAARPWADAWAEEARARLAADMDALAALSARAPSYPSTLPRTPVIRARLESIANTSEQVGAMVISVNYAASAYIDVLTAAASGDEEDLVRLDGARFGLAAAQLEAEMSMVLASNEGTTGPNLHWGRSQASSNRALIIWLNHKKHVFTGEPSEASVAANGIREQADAMRSEVAEMKSAIVELMAQMEREPRVMATSFGQMLGEIAASLEASAAVELETADALDDLADALQAADASAEEAVSRRIESLAMKRLAVDTARRALIARSQG